MNKIKIFYLKYGKDNQNNYTSKCKSINIGRCLATIKFGLTKGRYPEKSVRIMLNLLQNTKANDEAKKLNPEKLVIKKCICSSSQWRKKKNLYAHGSINAFCSSNCHAEILCEELKENVKKEKKEGEKKETRFISPMKHVRRAIAKNLGSQKYVKVGGKK